MVHLHNFQIYRWGYRKIKCLLMLINTREYRSGDLIPTLMFSPLVMTTISGYVHFFLIGNSDQLLKIFSVSLTFCLWGHGCILLCPTIRLHICSNFWNITNVSDLLYRLRPPACFTCTFSLREIPGWNLWALFCRNFNISSIPFCLVFHWEALQEEKTFTVPFLFWVSVFHCPSLW